MPRNLSVIASEIRKDWVKLSPWAAPYLEAMSSLCSVREDYFWDSGRSVVLYFLSNAGTWRGDVAKRIKLELKEMVK